MPKSNAWRRSGDSQGNYLGVFWRGWSAARRAGWIASLIIVALAGCGGSTDTQRGVSGVQVMGLKSDRMRYHVSQQQASNWCWAACVQMVLSTQGIAASQAEIVANATSG